MNKKFAFRDALLEYYYHLASMRNDMKRDELPEKELSHRRYMNMDWFHWIRQHAFEKTDIYIEIKDKRILNKKEFLLPEDERCPGCDDGKPYRAIKYRDHIIPIYDDDYGQQDFAKVCGQTISGGSYNFLSEWEFMDALDYQLQQDFLNEKYDMHQEITDLFPEWKENKEK